MAAENKAFIIYDDTLFDHTTDSDVLDSRVQQLKDIIALAGDQQEIYIFVVAPNGEAPEQWKGTPHIVSRLAGHRKGHDEPQPTIRLTSDVPLDEHDPDRTWTWPGESGVTVHINLFTDEWFEQKGAWWLFFDYGMHIQLVDKAAYEVDTFTSLAQALQSTRIMFSVSKSYGEPRYNTLVCIPGPDETDPITILPIEPYAPDLPE